MHVISHLPDNSSAGVGTFLSDRLSVVPDHRLLMTVHWKVAEASQGRSLCLSG